MNLHPSESRKTVLESGAIRTAMTEKAPSSGIVSLQALLKPPFEISFQALLVRDKFDLDKVSCLAGLLFLLGALIFYYLEI